MKCFRKIRLWSFGPRHCCDPTLASTYSAEDKHSFWHFGLPHSSTNTVTIYLSSFEVRYGAPGRVLVWNHVTDMVNPFNRMHFYEPPQWRMTNCVFFRCWMNEFTYDYRRKYDQVYTIKQITRLRLDLERNLSYINITQVTPSFILLST